MPPAPIGPEAAPCLPRTPYVNRLIDEAKVANNEKGVQAYSWDLAKFLIHSKAGKEYISNFSKRLATADLMAQRGEQKWVPERSVVKAFNEMMEQVAGSSGMRKQTDDSKVHRLRLSLNNTSPFLSSVTSHDDECLPTEAVLLVWLLMVSDADAGAQRPTLPPSKQGYILARFPTEPDTQTLVSSYSVTHSPHQLAELYEHLAHAIGF